MNLEDKTKFKVFVKRGTKIQPWQKESINDGVFSKEELEKYMNIYLSQNKWRVVSEKENNSSKRYTFKAVPHPDSEEAQKRNNFLYHIFNKEDYIHVKII